MIFPNHTYGLPNDERTLPQALKEAGYQTSMVGKWHLGHADKKYWPQNRGFDHFYGNLVGEVDYFSKMRGGIVDWQRDGKFMQETTYYLPLIGDEAVQQIERQDKTKPFFLYFASLAPHAPYQAQKADEQRYASSIKDPTRRTYAAMVTSVDDQVGRIVAALDKWMSCPPPWPWREQRRTPPTSPSMAGTSCRCSLQANPRPTTTS